MSNMNQRTTTLQIVVQILLFGSIWLVIPLIFNDLSLTGYDLRRGVQNLIGVAIIILLNVRWLLPTYYFRKNKTLYLVISILTIAFTYFIVTNIVVQLLPAAPPPRPRRGNPADAFGIVKQVNRLMPYVLAFIGSSLFEVSRFANWQSKQAIQLSNEKLAAEMRLLKSQINPHFLFNALNNVYSLSYLKPEQTPENLLKLSNMLRYVLYECNVERVTLEKEIAYLRNFINLQLLKDSRGMNVKADLEVAHPNLSIAPMLLIPFVENAFKHSPIENLKKGWIDIQLSTTASSIHLYVANSVREKESPKDNVGGIGMPTAKRLLELHYPDKHQLSIKATAEKYTVQLEIQVA